MGPYLFLINNETEMCLHVELWNLEYFYAADS